MLAIYLSSLLYISAFTAAQTSSSSVYVYNDGVTGSNFTFAINVAPNSQDLFFHLNGPSKFSWIAVGTGNQMKDSLMFVVYASGDGKNVTLSPRIASGHTEPTYNSSLNVALLPGTTLSNNSFVVNAQCSNCRSWSSGSLDVTSRTQNFIYALGPDVVLRSDDKAAGLQEHGYYGIFSMDLVQATGSGGLPNNTLSDSGSATVESLTRDSNWSLEAHLAAMLAAFVVFFPMGYLLLRYFGSVKYHQWMQTFAVVVALVGGGLGIYESLLFNQSKSFSSGHQIIGIAVCLLLIPQWLFGYIHHKQYPQKRRRTWITQSHRILGPSLLVVALVNGGIGFKFADAQTTSIIVYAVVVAVIAVIIGVMVMWKTRQKKLAADYGTPAPEHYREVYSPEGVYPSEIALTKHTSTPAGYDSSRP